MDKKRPQLSADEVQQLKWLLGGLLTLLALSSVFYMDIDAWALMGLTTAATLAAIARPDWPARVPSLVHTLAFPAIVIVFALDLWLQSEVLPAMVRLDLLLLLYRNLSYRQRRDDLQVIVLGLFLIVVAGVLTVSLAFAVQLLVYTACALGFLFTITLTDGAPGTKRVFQRPEPGQVPSWAAHADWPALFRRLRQVIDWRVAALGTALFAGVVVVSALLFLAIPRFQLDNGMFLDRFITKKAKSGFSDTVRFGDVTDIQQDNSVALSVDVSDQSQIPVSPYWRMMVLDEYRDGTFRMSTALRLAAFAGERTQSFLRGAAPMTRGAGVTWTFYLESGISRYLPLAGPFEQLMFREAQNYNFAGDLNLVALKDEPVTMTAYRVDGLIAADTLADEKFAARWKTRDRRVSGLQSRTVAADSDVATLLRLLKEATGGSPLTAREFSTRVGAWLRANHAYSLSPRIPAGEGDPLVRWLASHEAGHCELFAGSLVLLARQAGFPARLVTGFKGGSWNGYSGNFTIRNSDAHAWTEIFDPAAGVWLRSDPLEAPTAAQAVTTGAAALAQRADRSWSARFDSLRVFWYRRIVSFDQRSQTATLKAMKEATQNSGKVLRAAIEARVAALKAWVTAPWDGRRGLKFAAVLLALAGLAWLGREYGGAGWRALWGRGRRHGVDPVRREAGRLLGRFAAAEADGAEHAPVVAELQRLRFGARETWRQPETVLRRARQSLRTVRRGGGWRWSRNVVSSPTRPGDR